MNFKKDKKIFNALFDDDLETFISLSNKCKVRIDNISWDEVILAYGSKNIFSYHLEQKCNAGVYNLLIDTIEKKRFDLMPLVLEKFNFKDQMNNKEPKDFANYFIDNAIRSEINSNGLIQLIEFYKKGLLTIDLDKTVIDNYIKDAYVTILKSSCSYNSKTKLPLDRFPSSSLKKFLNHKGYINSFSYTIGFEKIFNFYIENYGFDGLSMEKFEKEFKEKATVKLL